MGRLIPPLVRTPNTISNSELNEAANSFWQLCLNKFPSFRFLRNENDHNEDNNHQVRRQQREEHTPIEDDDDAVVVVSMEEYEASMARSSACGNSSTEMKTKMLAEHQSRFPILFAAVLPHEDIVMTCARALDERVDVSLVREAAQYLEEVVDSGRDELVG